MKKPEVEKYLGRALIDRVLNDLEFVVMIRYLIENPEEFIIKKKNNVRKSKS